MTEPTRGPRQSIFDSTDSPAHQGVQNGLSGGLSELLARALRAQESYHRRAIKGAEAQKAAARERQQEWERTAATLIASRRSAFPSYRALAAAVASRSCLEGSVETIRKHLAAVQILD